MITINFDPLDNRHLADICGDCDANLQQIERSLGVIINRHGAAFEIIGSQAAAVERAEHTLQALHQAALSNLPLTAAKIHLLMKEIGSKVQFESTPIYTAPVAINTNKGLIRARTPNQENYLQRIQAHDINFGIGPAGTGKTYLAVACAVDALQRDAVQRILLVRPAVEAGEKLGFLPGDMAQKVDPYLRPLYDALFEMLGFEKVGKLIEKGVIEIAPLAFMRGRTLNHTFAILDEGQNTTKEQMKMFLTRLGFGSKAVITGDITQVDLPKITESGLRQAAKVLKDVQQISFTYFQPEDTVRHPLIQRIVEAYTAYEQPS